MTNETSDQFVVRPPNWLPLPQVIAASALPTRPVVVDENDLFPKGEITQFYPHQGYGYIKNNQGEEIIFKLSELDLVGEKADASYLTVGAPVGYDVSQASDGLHIRILKIY